MRLLTCLLVVGTIALSSGLKAPYKIQETQLKSLEKFAAKGITQALIWKLTEDINSRGAGADPKFPIFPNPIEDPLSLNETDICDFKIVIPDVIDISGDLNIEDSQVTGLSKLLGDLIFIPRIGTGTTVNITISLPTVSIEGPYVLNSTINSQGQTNNLYGDGNYTGSVEDVFLNVHAFGRTPMVGKMSLERLEVDLGFKNLIFNPEGMSVDGEPEDLSHLAGLVESIFRLVWTPDSKLVINELVRCTLNHTVHNCNLNELLNGGVECLILEPSPHCGTSNEPTTVVPTGPTTPVPTGPTTPVPTGSTGPTTTETPGGGSVSLEASKLFILLALGYSFVF